QGAIESVKTDGLLGAFAGGIQATAVGISVAVVFGYVMAVIFNPQG
ncbi:MAG TPA: SpoVA/SpoVAEb family sporulation membrane protein, partial [Clostridia bacterium]|nr:SpoVA/SpoVAEb family sporulation membrane protein [Clostridia bacterium]